MSDDLISRQAALDAIDKNRQDLLSLGMDGAEHILVHYGRRIIEELPTAEVTLCHLDSPCEYQNADIAMPSAESERKKGRWIKLDGSLWNIAHCSECGEMCVLGETAKFCPFCGATMVGVITKKRRRRG